MPSKWQEIPNSPVRTSAVTGIHACTSVVRHSWTASSGTCAGSASHELPSASAPASWSARGPSPARGMHPVHPTNTRSRCKQVPTTYNKNHWVIENVVLGMQDVFQDNVVVVSGMQLLRLRSAIRRHHPPQRAVLSQICCFGERKVVLSQILLDGAEPRDAGTTLKVKGQSHQTQLTRR